MERGTKAVTTTGFPHELLSLTMLFADKLNVSLALRVGQPPNACKGFPVAPKPMCVKTKTCNDSQHIPFLSGFIPYNQALFGRSQEGNFPNDQTIIHLQVSLYEILAGMERDEYCDFHYENDTLTFKAKHADFTIKNNISFKINLSAGKPPLQYDNNLLTKLTPWVEKTPLTKPAFWDETVLGNFNDAVNFLYTVSYSQQQSEYIPMKVLATADKKAITGDVDILWVAVPIDYAQAKNHKQYNTANAKERAELIESLKILSQKLNMHFDATKLQKITEFAKTAGIITAYELLFEVAVNEEFSKVDPYFNNLYQHGAETNNPGKPSPLNSKILHFHKGMLVLTENEDELIKFVMQPDYLEQNYIRVHPGWNMQKWSQVVERQLHLKQHVNPETVKRYHASCRHSSQNKFSQSMNWNSLKCTLFGASKQAKKQENVAEYLHPIAACGN